MRGVPQDPIRWLVVSRRERQDMAAATAAATGWAGREDPEICDGNHLAAGDKLRARAACRLVGEQFRLAPERG
jgi:hypothetical protein